jgi:hypothetical protein
MPKKIEREKRIEDIKHKKGDESSRVGQGSKAMDITNKNTKIACCRTELTLETDVAKKKKETKVKGKGDKERHWKNPHPKKPHKGRSGWLFLN